MEIPSFHGSYPSSPASALSPASWRGAGHMAPTGLDLGLRAAHPGGLWAGGGSGGSISLARSASAASEWKADAPAWPRKAFFSASPGRLGDMRGPSHAAHLQNSKAQWCLMRMERSDSAPHLRPLKLGMAEASVSRTESDAVAAGESGGDTESRARAFQEGAVAVDELLARGAAAARSDESLRSREEVQRQLDQEEAKRRRESDLRRARRREREARDPHRKVALKLENRRRFGQGDDMDATSDVATDAVACRLKQPTRCRSQVADEDGIPMQVIDVASANGNVHQVAVVDVRSLRAKCQGLAEGGPSGPSAVRSLLEQQRRREKLASYSMPALPAPQARLQTR